ncbi:MAG: radical SAM protein [Cytophagales bacterium]
MIISDIYNRTFKTLRVSLLNSCNLGCTYCVNEENKIKDKRLKIKDLKYGALSYLELSKTIKKLHSILNFETIRLTGGEPTLYKDLVPLLNDLSDLKIPMKLTTNGLLLKNSLSKLPTNVLDSINISIDALDEEVFYKISGRRNLQKVLEGIDLAIALKIHVKLNCVVIKGVNESQILPLLKYAGKKGVTIRFLEIMKMGHLQDSAFDNAYVSENEILENIQSLYSTYKLSRNKSATANYWLTDSGIKFGIIANESEPFCHDCNRLRLDSFGNIYGCLSDNTPLNISKFLDNDLTINEILKKALAQKQPLKFKGSGLSMLEIGG